MRVILTIIIIFALTTCLPDPVSASPERRAAEAKIRDSLLSGYDPRVRPPGLNETSDKSGPVIVQVNFLVRAIPEISTQHMDYSTQLTFRQEWTDSRLKFDDVNGSISFVVLQDEWKIWIPDLFFSNSVDEGMRHQLMKPNTLIRIFPNGNVLFSTRLSLKLFCPMDLMYYPFDMQTCHIKMASYGFTTKDIVFQWKSKGPVQLPSKLNMKEFTLAEHEVSYCNSKTSSGEYSCIVANFVFRREGSKLMRGVFIPTFLMVVMSYLTLFVRSDDARIGISILVSLFLVTHVTIMDDNFPKVSYTTMMDVWIRICLFFSISAILLSVLMRQLPVNIVRWTSVRTVNENASPLVKNQVSESGQNLRQRMSAKLVKVRMECGVRIAFPVLFLMTAFFFWLDCVFRFT